MEADYIDTYTTVLRNTSRMTAKDLVSSQKLAID